MNTQENEINMLIPKKIKYFFASMIGLMVISIVIFIIAYFNNGYKILSGELDFNIITAFGTLLSGLLGPILSIISSLLFYYSLKTQYFAYKEQLIENKESVRQFTVSAKNLEEQKLIMMQQNWEQVYFKLLEEYDSYISSLTYCIEYFYEKDSQNSDINGERVIEEIIINKENNGKALQFKNNQTPIITVRNVNERNYLEKNERLHNNIMLAIIQHISNCSLCIDSYLSIGSLHIKMKSLELFAKNLQGVQKMYCDKFRAFLE